MTILSFGIFDNLISFPTAKLKLVTLKVNSGLFLAKFNILFCRFSFSELFALKKRKKRFLLSSRLLSLASILFASSCFSFYCPLFLLPSLYWIFPFLLLGFPCSLYSFTSRSRLPYSHSLCPLLLIIYSLLDISIALQFKCISHLNLTLTFHFPASNCSNVGRKQEN